MVLCHSRYRLVGLDGLPHPVLDIPYDSFEHAVAAASNWCNGQGSRCSPGQRGIAVEVWTANGEWRTIDYPMNCLRPSPMAPA